MSILDEVYNYMVDVTNKLLSKAIKPDKKYADVKEINLEEVKRWKSKYGIGGVILDIDGTVREDFKNLEYKNIKWILDLKKELKVCIVSNGNDKRIKQLADKIGIEYYGFSFKPMRKAFLNASESMGLDPENVLVIGNEYLADIFGGKRNNMCTTLIDKKDEEKTI